MTDVAGIRNARVALARRFDAAPPPPSGFTFAGIAVPLPRRSYGRSYANRSVPIRRVKIEIVPGFNEPRGTLFKLGGDTEPQRPADAVTIEYGSQVSLRMFGFNVESVYVSRLFGQCAIHVNFTVPDRVTGKPLTLTYNHAILPNATKHYMAEQTAVALANAFQHEVRERLYLGAKHFIDPHPESHPEEF